MEVGLGFLLEIDFFVGFFGCFLDIFVCFEFFFFVKWFFLNVFCLLG